MIFQIAVFALDLLLLSTLIYLAVFMKKLTVLKTYKADMRTIVDDVFSTTEAARESIKKLKAVALDTQLSMAHHLDDVKRMEKSLTQKIEEARGLLATYDPAPARGRSPSLSTDPLDLMTRRSTEREPMRDRLEDRMREDIVLAQLKAGGHRDQSKAFDDHIEREVESSLDALSKTMISLRAKVAANP